MRRFAVILTILAMLFMWSCSKKEASTAEAPKPDTAAAPAPEPAAQAPTGPRASVNLKSGSTVKGVIVASTATDMVVTGDDGVEHKIPLAQIKSVEYGDSQPAKPAPETAAAPRRASQRAAEQTARSEPRPAPEPAPAQQAAPPAVMTTKTYELPAGTDISIRTNEAINSDTASEGQTFDAQVTRDARDANGDVVIPRGADARVVIKSASKGGRFRGATDLVLDLQTVTIAGKRYAIDTVDVSKKSKEGIGANKRTAEYTGGAAALGAIIGAIAGGGKGAAIGAGAGAGAGALTQVLTRGRTIKVPAESVLTFSLDKPLRVARMD